MTALLVLNDKGGVGKSTIAPELAVYLYDLGRSVAVIDADRSLATAKHIYGAEPEIPVGAFFEVDLINQTVPQLKAQHDFVVADAPANLGRETLALLTHADVVIIPTVPAMKVFEGTVKSYQLVEEARKATGGNPRFAFVVFNRVDMRRKKKFMSYMEKAVQKGLPVTRAFIRELAPFADAEEKETTITRMKRTPLTREAKADLTSFFAEMFEVMHTEQVANG